MAQRFASFPLVAPGVRLLLASARVAVRRFVTSLACLVTLVGVPATASADPGAAAEAREAVLTDRLARIDRDLAKAGRELAAIRKRFGARARAIYEGGYATDPVAVMLSAPDPENVVARLDLFHAATSADDDLVRRGAGLARRLSDARRVADAARREAASVVASLRRDNAELRGLLSRLEAAGRRAPRASRAARLSGRYACLVGPNHSYADTWGAPRSGGRTHKGTDVMAPWGSPAYAVTSGVIRRESYSSNGGMQVYLAGSDGNEYFYAHMSSYVARTGQHVAVGEEIAKVGDTGNARGTPHVHFEVHPGGGTPVNPYPYVRRFCG